MNHIYTWDRHSRTLLCPYTDSRMSTLRSLQCLVSQLLTPSQEKRTPCSAGYWDLKIIWTKQTKNKEWRINSVKPPAMVKKHAVFSDCLCDVVSWIIIPKQKNRKQKILKLRYLISIFLQIVIDHVNVFSNEFSRVGIFIH